MFAISKQMVSLCVCLEATVMWGISSYRCQKRHPSLCERHIAVCSHGGRIYTACCTTSVRLIPVCCGSFCEWLTVYCVSSPSHRCVFMHPRARVSGCASVGGGSRDSLKCVYTPRHRVQKGRTSGAETLLCSSSSQSPGWQLFAVLKAGVMGRLMDFNHLFTCHPY